PKVPSVLLIGVDVSESMSVKDEINGQARLDAVKKALERSQSALDDLAEQNVEVIIYKFSTPDFHPDTWKFDPKDAADGKRSDYGTYLNKTYEKWQTEKFIRGHIVIGDGRDNGLAFSAFSESGRWGRRGVPVTTVVVGDPNTSPDKKDIAVVGLACVPAAAPIKTDVEGVAEVNAYNYKGATVKARGYVNDEEQRHEEFVHTKQHANQLQLKIKAHTSRGEVGVRVEVGQETTVGDKSVVTALPNEVSDQNNSTETYLTVTKEGVRVLVIDRLRWEETLLRDALRGEKRFDLYEVIRQSNLPPTPDEQKWLDPDAPGYHRGIIGNIPINELPAGLTQKITERVTQKGMGLMFLGGENAFQGIPPPSSPDPRTRPLEFADLIPVTPAAGKPWDIVENKEPKTGELLTSYQFVPTEKGFEDRVIRIAPNT